jgi:transcription antitermination factor NusG
MRTTSIQGPTDADGRKEQALTGRAITGLPRWNARRTMTLQLEDRRPEMEGGLTPALTASSPECRWYAVFTLPQNEKSAVKQLALRGIEAFLPTYETVRVWKNRQRVRTVLPLFPTYLFVHIDCRQRGRVLSSPGVLHIVGNSREQIPVPDAEIELLRSGVRGRNLEPYHELLMGSKVRIKSGSMEGVEGVLVRKGNGLRFVLALKMINQYAAIEVDAEDLEPAVE